jgi:hypothetical protein
MKSTMLALAFATIAVATSPARATTLSHIPPAEAVAGTAIELVADAPPMGDAIVLHYRAAGAQQFVQVEFARRQDDRWIAAIPATAAAPPAVEYYIDRGDAPVFATAGSPHAIRVRAGARDERRARDLDRVGGRRSRLHVAGEWVDYAAADEADDRYYRVDADFSYRLLSYPIEEIRVGYTYLIGTTDGQQAGFKAGGWFELGLGLVEGARLDGRVLAMATPEGFALGGRGELRAGSIDASHVAIGAEVAADVGSSGFFRLGWDTVPRVPMSATVEVGNLPSSSQPTGVRLIYDAYFPVYPGVRAGVRVGYAARDQRIGGFTGGLGATWDF